MELKSMIDMKAIRKAQAEIATKFNRVSKAIEASDLSAESKEAIAAILEKEMNAKLQETLAPKPVVPAAEPQAPATEFA